MAARDQSPPSLPTTETSGQLEHSWETYYAPELTWYRHLRNVLHHLPMFRAVGRLRPERVLEVGAGTGSHSICTQGGCHATSLS